MEGFLRSWLVLGLAALVAGCATLDATHSPSADLDALKLFYVQKLPADGRGIDVLIANQLNSWGYEATHGAAEKPPFKVDAVVTYQDRWTWDITMYMLRLTVQVRDGATGAILGSAESYRPSLQRRSPEAMVEETLKAVLKRP